MSESGGPLQSRLSAPTLGASLSAIPCVPQVFVLATQIMRAFYLNAPLCMPFTKLLVVSQSYRQKTIFHRVPSTRTGLRCLVTFGRPLWQSMLHETSSSTLARSQR